MKKIIIFNAGSFLYGAERGLINLVKAIKGKFYITVVLSKKGPLEEKLKNISVNIDVKIFPLPILVASFSPFYIVKTILFSILSFIYFIPYVIFRKTDTIVTNSLILFFPAIISKITNKKHIWYIREFTASKFLNKILGLFIKAFSSRIICQSEIINDKLGIKNKAGVVYEPLDSDDYKIYDYFLVRKEFGFPDSSKIVSIISRIHPSKGQYEFIKKFQNILVKRKDIFLLIVGDISCLTAGSRRYKRKIKEIIRKNNLKNVLLLGYRADVDRILSLSDICVFPFRRDEPFGIAVAEALAFGKKTFYPKRGGLKEVYKIFGSGEDLTAGGVSKALFSLESGRPRGMDKLYIPDILSFKVYQDKITGIIGQ